MNGSGKQSFYEIQLNNGSLIAAFLVAVALGVAVFMLGVMVGRGQAPEPLDQEGGWVEDLGTAEAGEPDSGADQEFFEKVQESDEPETEPVASDPVAADPEPARTEAAADPPVTQVEGLPESDPALASGFVIQVKSTPDRADADALQEALAASGFPAWVIEGDVRGNTTYRVRVGRYRTAEEAMQVEEALKARSDIQDTWVTTG